MKKSKKLFLFGKLRELETPGFDDEVVKDLQEYTGIKEDIEFYELPDPDGKGTEFVIGLSTTKTEKDRIALEMARMILGECKSFKPEYPAYTGPRWPGFNHCSVFLHKEDFAETLKANNKFYGGSRIRSVDVIQDDRLGTIIRLRW